MRQTVLAMGIAAACLAPASGQQRVSPDQALARLKSGNDRFVKGRSLARPLDEGVRRTLARGETPYAIIVTSSDSRMVPEHVFNAGLGELFVIRTAGNVADPDTLASIEYAAERLGTQLCVVLAVEGCSAVRLAARTADKHESQVLSQLAEQISPAIRQARREGLEGEDLLAKAEVENAYTTVLECLRRSRSLRALREAGRFHIVAARYRSDDGHVEWLPERHYADRTHIRPKHRRKLRGLSPDAALKMLQAGHRRFLSPARATGDISAQRRQRVARSHEAVAIVITCSDSRVAPEHLFDSGLGELFVVRVGGNALSDQVLASIEQAIAVTGASICVVLGHSECGVMAAAIEDAHDHDDRLSASMRHLLQKLAPAVKLARQRARDPKDLMRQAIRINVLRVVGELRAQSRFLERLEQEGRFRVLPAIYQIDTGDIFWLKEGEARGQPLSLEAGSSPLGSVGSTGPVDPAESPAAAGIHGGRGRALVLALLAAILVVVPCLLVIRIWQRRILSMDSEPDPDDYLLSL